MSVVTKAVQAEVLQEVEDRCTFKQYASVHNFSLGEHEEYILQNGL